MSNIAFYSTNRDVTLTRLVKTFGGLKDVVQMIVLILLGVVIAKTWHIVATINDIFSLWHCLDIFVVKLVAKVLYVKFLQSRPPITETFRFCLIAYFVL